MKRWVSLFLSAALCCSLPTAALAAEAPPASGPAAGETAAMATPETAVPEDLPLPDVQPAPLAAAEPSDYTGLHHDADGIWRYYTDGVFDAGKTGVVMYGENWFYVTDGVLDANFAGMVTYNGELFYVSAGQVRTDLTGLIQNVDGQWYYLSSGQVRDDYSGRVWYNDNCFIITNGMLDTGANGIIEDEGHLYYASYGQIQLSLTGLVQDTDGSWYYITLGQVREDYSGLALYNDNWFIITDGRLDIDYTGLYPYNNELFIFTAGQMRIDFTGESRAEGYRCYFVSGQLRNVLPDIRTPDEIRSFLASHPFDTNGGVSYAVSPSLSGNQPGSLSDATIQDGLNAVNYIRYVAGLPADVQVADAYMQRAQAGAFVLAKNDTGLSHYPSNTSGIPDDLYQLGRKGTSSSNIGAHYGYGQYNLSYSIVNSYMEDGDISNISSVGHRRWILSPSLNHIGFGFCTSNRAVDYTTTYVFDDLMESSVYPVDYVAWPAENMPSGLLQGPWSLSLSPYVYASDLSGVWVRMTNLHTGQCWVFDSSTNSDPTNTSAPFFSRDSYTYGRCYGLVFTPRVNFGSGDQVQIEVYGLKEADTGAETSIAYTVNFF